MGYTILLQWTYNPPNRPPVPVNEIVLTRILEHYNLASPLRSTIQLRTFRASLPTSPDQQSTRVLTTIAYSQPVPPVRDAVIPPTPRDDVTYLFMEDKGRLKRGEGSNGPRSVAATNGSVPRANGQNRQNGQNGHSVPDRAKDQELEDEGFEIVEPPSGSVPNGETESKQSQPTIVETAQKDKKRYQTLAVRPSAAVLPLLQNLLSPFVMGLTKSARAAASTTAETPRPTPLPGTSSILTSLTFPPLSSPSPPLALTIHNLPNASASTIFLEAEYEGSSDPSFAEPILREFLEGCVPGGIGEIKFMSSESGGEWTGIERSRRATEMLARTLREGGFI
ncbi:hypothetical protein EHS25_002054 [Saitozyma podzolica]|uniref:Mediator complex subunit 20 n=1 Tax=Saitozyma podzolica TaxID=1890683 RepID=A0A427YEX6_9TREE|nr:hypothetical protein EHS25_002054 [Saitozyma podzolica]